MARQIRLGPCLTDAELHERYRCARDPVERSRWQFLWLLTQGMTAVAVARATGCSACWIGQIARHYNREGPGGIRDRRHAALRRV